MGKKLKWLLLSCAPLLMFSCSLILPKADTIGVTVNNFSYHSPVTVTINGTVFDDFEAFSSAHDTDEAYFEIPRSDHDEVVVEFDFPELSGNITHFDLMHVNIDEYSNYWEDGIMPVTLNFVPTAIEFIMDTGLFLPNIYTSGSIRYGDYELNFSFNGVEGAGYTQTDEYRSYGFVERIYPETLSGTWIVTTSSASTTMSNTTTAPQSVFFLPFSN